MPPHEWNVDFPHLMLRAKAVKFRNGETRFRDKLLSTTDAIGKLAAIPVVAQTVNAVNCERRRPRLMEKVLGVHQERKLPPYSREQVPQPTPREPKRTRSKNGERTPGKVAVFATCYVNYNEPGIGHDLLKVLEHNEIPYVLVEKEACCGMPKLELGDLDAVERLKRVNIPPLAKLARDGYAILTGDAVLHADVQGGAAAAVSRMTRTSRRLPRRCSIRSSTSCCATATACSRPISSSRSGKVSYHIPCHSRVQNIGQKTRELLELVPGTQVNTVERCSGHDGTWGVKTEYFANSMKIGRPVFRAMAGTDPDYISSDCAIAGRHIEQGMGDTRARREHPLTLLRIAYGLPERQ